MPNRLYEETSQLANLTAPEDPGYDVVPGNVVKLAFVLLSGATMTAVTIITSEAWQTAITAAAGGKHVITPFIDGFEIAPTTPITEAGNDNSTYNGVPRLRSTSFAAGKGMFSGVSPEQMDALRKMVSKSGNFQHGTRLGMYLLHEGGGITAMEDGKPIPVFNVFISDPKKGGLGASEDCNLEFHLEGGWSVGTKIFEANFKVATLVNPAP